MPGGPRRKPRPSWPASVAAAWCRARRRPTRRWPRSSCWPSGPPTRRSRRPTRPPPRRWPTPAPRRSTCWPTPSRSASACWSKAHKKADAVAEERARMLNDQVAALSAAKADLETDVTALTTHLELERDRLREAIESVRAALDDPEGLRLAPTPELLDTPVPHVDLPTPSRAPQPVRAGRARYHRDPRGRPRARRRARPAPDRRRRHRGVGHRRRIVAARHRRPQPTPPTPAASISTTRRPVG